MGLAVDGANQQDMRLVRAMVDRLPVARPAPSLEYPQGLCLDKGYDFDEVRRTLDESEERCSVMTSTGVSTLLSSTTHEWGPSSCKTSVLVRSRTCWI